MFMKASFFCDNPVREGPIILSPQIYKGSEVLCDVSQIVAT